MERLVHPTLCRLVGGKRRDAVELHCLQHVVHVTRDIGRTTFAIHNERMLQQYAVFGTMGLVFD